MFSRLRPSQRGRNEDRSQEDEYSAFADIPETTRNRVVGRQTVETEPEDEADDDDNGNETYRSKGGPSYFDRQPHQRRYRDNPEEEDGEEDENEVDTPLLPIFSAPHLDRLPLYNITHSIRLLIVQRCETTLSWDQLRTPQISQFLVKPIQSEIRTNHFNRATLCALIANCLQFQKEGQTNPGNVGVCKTRGLISELLAMRLVKEFTTRELIDALSYDFDPLQGMTTETTAANNAGRGTPSFNDLQARRTAARGARVSTIEIAIRAQAKRFLAHTVVVQHLEAIWAGTIVFHAEADSLHRKPASPLGNTRNSGYGAINEHAPSNLPADAIVSRKSRDARLSAVSPVTRHTRRSATLYDPRDASLFKLSRLRVPRYRQVLATFSYATMLGLFIAVLVDRSLTITPLEIVFWIWSAGYMLDEIVGFTEQGFGLYILSFWNAFDLGILFLFVAYYCLRLYGIVIADQNKHHIASMAYDVLASTAVLLFPRLFSVLDHYRYFSQLLIAFRMMAQDLMAVLVLIIISCSGFFVAFTLSFSDEKTDANAVAYALFQLLMGFTPAAWEKWSSYNILGKGIMAVFMIICHFLIVTILITVLTNSFMAIVQNANEEHQFLFAINTISMVKSDALFSYVAPTNVIGWLLSPLRWFMPIRQYVKLNRYIIKVTHFPVLLIIFGYERIVLTGLTYEPTDLIEKMATKSSRPFAMSINKAQDLFSPGHRLREPSVISFHKSAALDEVFRRPFRGSTVRTTTRGMDRERRNSTNAVDKWMQLADEEGGASPPLEQPRSVLEQLETRRPKTKRALTGDRLGRRTRGFGPSAATKSVVSDPDFLSTSASRRPHRIEEESESIGDSNDNIPQETDADGDDEINDESDAAPMLGESAISVAPKNPSQGRGSDDDDDDVYQTPVAKRSPFMQMSSAARARMQQSPEMVHSSAVSYQGKPLTKRAGHGRQASSTTILFAPDAQDESSTSNPIQSSRSKNVHNSGTNTPDLNNSSAAQKTPNILIQNKLPKSRPTSQAKTRPSMLPHQQTMPKASKGLTFIDIARRPNREPSFNARALDLASDIGDNRFGPSIGFDAGGISGMPASFSEQLLREREAALRRAEDRRRSEEEEKGMVNRIMLSRMNTLEEGFREVLREIKDLSAAASHQGSTRRNSENEFGPPPLKSRYDRLRAAPPEPNTATSSSIGYGTSPALKTTLVGRISGNEKNPAARTSPIKAARRLTKGKEVDRPSSAGSAGAIGVVATDSAGSAQSQSPGGTVQAASGAARSVSPVAVDVEVQRPSRAVKMGDEGRDSE
ncbi:Hypothetical protein R9X50_00730700 [Acrodontium crateriforme]|uniref:Ion transport domain-containing protein n=1 Tax=Acrodontium crateriforme TaxID=150365 RepID=A0AAQ3R7I8_9PEZI|nr:Hypothetical protein R9X50_00730700 [Acrodontium crateriforme]